MKEGAGDDLLNNIDEDADEGDDATPLDTPVPETADTDTEASTDTDDDSIPYLLRRNRVKEGRETVGFGLQKETRDLEDDVLREVKTDLDIEKLATTDLREAAYLAGLQHPERIKEILLAWGYEHRR